MAKIKPRNNFCTEIIICIFSVIFFFAVPILVILFSPIYLFRYFVHLSSGILRPDLGKIMSARSTIFAVDDLYNAPRATLVIAMILEGEVSLAQIRQYFIANLLQRTGTQNHPELLQYISSWMGFYFWKTDKAFKIENHIKEYDGSVQFDIMNDTIMNEIGLELVNKPFIRNRSPWEMIVIPSCRLANDETPGVTKSLGFFRIHHSAADGFSLTKLLVSDLCGNKLETAQPNYQSKNICRQIWDSVTFMFRLPHDVVSTYVKSADPIGDFHLPEEKLSRRSNIAMSPKLPIEFIKEIRDINKVSFAAVLMAGLTAALRLLMLEHSGYVPEYISIIAPTPVPGHPDKLRNHMSAVIISLPVGISDSEKRLRVIESNLEALKRSTFPVFLFYLSKLGGSLFPCMTRVLAKQYGPTVIMSSFPGPINQIQFAGQPGIDCMFYGGTLPGNIGIGAGTLSYNGKIRFTIGIDENIVPSSERSMESVMDCLLRELDFLRHKQIV